MQYCHEDISTFVHKTNNICLTAYIFYSYENNKARSKNFKQNKEKWVYLILTTSILLPRINVVYPFQNSFRHIHKYIDTFCLYQKDNKYKWFCHLLYILKEFSRWS